MPLKVLIVPDKFKGTLTAHAAAKAIGAGWRAVRPDDALELLPMSDGGDGFGEVLSRLLPTEERMTPTVDAAHLPCEGKWWWAAKDKIAIIESAQVIGLARLPPRKFHPFELDTSGLGALFLAAAQSGAGRILVGIGGSATNDAGFGLARALGWQFRDEQQRPIEKWTALTSLAQIRAPEPQQMTGEVVVAVDVQNPLLGSRGATRVYGPQKGLRPEDFPLAEACHERLATVVKDNLEMDCAGEPGAGAAGGLGFGLSCFLNARLERGFEIFSGHAKLEERIRRAELVITGEGAIDATSLMGKGVGEVAERCRRQGMPCIGLAGALPDASFHGDSATAKLAKEKFVELDAITPGLTTVEKAKTQAAYWLARLARRVAQERKWAAGL